MDYKTIIIAFMSVIVIMLAGVNSIFLISPDVDAGIDGLNNTNNTTLTTNQDMPLNETYGSMDTNAAPLDPVNTNPVNKPSNNYQNNPSNNHQNTEPSEPHEDSGESGGTAEEPGESGESGGTAAPITAEG